MASSSLKVALVHEWLTNWAGSEKVLLRLHQLFPEAPIYTSVFVPKALPAIFRSLDIRTSFLQRFPFRRNHRLWLPLMPLAFESFDLRGYDVVISNSHACAKGVLTPYGTWHICYCYSPTRYVWDRYHEYLHSEEGRGVRRRLFPCLMHSLRLWDFQAAQRPDTMVAISHFVRRRIQKYYRREAEVIYPPLEWERFEGVEMVPYEEREFFLVVSRLVRHKRVDLAVEACSLGKLPLKVVGEGPERRRLERMAGSMVEFLGWQPDEIVVDLYRRARAVIFPSEDDFGLVPLEAMACGTPVVAYAGGGALETVVEGETGLFFHEPTAEALLEALRQLGKQEWVLSRLRQQAERFKPQHFLAAWQRLLQRRKVDEE